MKLYLYSKGKEVIKVEIKNTISHDIIKKTIERTFLKENHENILQLTMISSNIGAFFFNKIKRNNRIFTKKAGPALNMQILGTYLQIKSIITKKIPMKVTKEKFCLMLIFFFHSLLQLGQVQPRSGSPGTDVGQTRSLCIGWSICHVMLLQNQGTSLTTLHGGSLSVTRSSSIQFHNYCNDI